MERPAAKAAESVRGDDKAVEVVVEGDGGVGTSADNAPQTRIRKFQLSETVTLELLQGPGEPYWLGRYPVTQEQYEAIIGSNPSSFKGRRRPVERVSWKEAQAFCRRLGEKFGGSFGLPGEAIWEKACRAGTTTDFNNGTDNNPGEVGWVKENSGKKNHDVGEKRPNAWGFYDMHGNVWEWCDDWYDTIKSLRVVRGGSWDVSSERCTSSHRHCYSPGYRNRGIGFRVCWRPRS